MPIHGTFKLGDRVRVHLYTHRGVLIRALEGTISDFAPDTEVAPGVRKNLVWVTGIERYQRPNDLGEPVSADEGWFADTDIEKVEDEAVGGYRVFSN